MNTIGRYATFAFFIVLAGCMNRKQESEQSLNLKSPEINQASKILSATFNVPVKIVSVIQLTEPERRNRVVRIILDDAHSDVPKSVIFKQSLEEENKTNKKAYDRFARDWAGLEFVNTLETEMQLISRFYGGSKEYCFIVFEDLGEKHLSVVDYLLVKDAEHATAVLQKFMRSLGQLHAYSYGKTDKYVSILNELNPTAPSWQDDLRTMSDDILPKLESVLSDLEIPNKAGVQQAAAKVLKSVLEPGSFTTFIHGDCCPDNTFYNREKNTLLLIDFELGFVRSALLDGTYLRMSMPTCWCAKALPEDIIESLESLYRKELMKKISAALDDDAYYTAYVNACAYWMLHAVLSIRKIKDADLIQPPVILPEGRPKFQPEAKSSQILSRIQAFINVSRKYNKLPELRSMAEGILQKLKTRWPNVKPMGLFPAYER